MDVIDVMPEQTGMISSFKFTDASDPLVKWLLLTDAQRAVAHPPSKQLLLAAMTGKWANSQKSHEIRATGETLLKAGQQRRCTQFLDVARASLSPHSADIKIVLDQSAFLALLGVESLAQHDQLMALHPSSSKIALRRTEGPVEGCIGFHIDGGHATHTVQLTLNDCSEHEGGRLCFVTGANAVLSIPHRPAGTLTKHDSDVFHGVTKLCRGVRHSLFVVDESNGLGERDVHHVDEAIVSRMSPLGHHQVCGSILGLLIAPPATLVPSRSDHVAGISHTQELGPKLCSGPKAVRRSRAGARGDPRRSPCSQRA